MDLMLDATSYHTDSKVVLGYICNESKWFYTSTIESNISTSPRSLISGTLCTWMKTLQTMFQDSYLYPTWCRHLGSMNPTSCNSHLQKIQEQVTHSSSSNLKRTHKSDHWFKPVLLTYMNRYLPLSAFDVSPPLPP